MTSTLDELVGKVLGGRYRLVSPIASGSSARVFLADDTTLRRRVAVKVLHAGLADDDVFLKRFRAEAQAVAALNHPHVMAVYDWGHDEVPYLVSEFLAGGSLRAMLDGGHRLSPSQALLVGLEAARGLEYAHKRGIVHRDIKPANLLFDDESRLRIADFGLARALAEAAWTEPSGVMLGTLRYASPEQARGDALTGKSDIYSLALVLFEAIAGEAPFASDTAIGTLMARVDASLHAPPEFGALGPAIERAADPDPARRPDAAEFSIALLAVAEELTRPTPLPLAGAIPRGERVDEDRDPTLIAATEVVQPPAAKSDVVVSDLPAVIDDRPVLVSTPRSATTLRREYAPPANDRPPRRGVVFAGLGVVLAMVAAVLAVVVVQRSSGESVPDLANQPLAALEVVAAKNGWLLQRTEIRIDTVAEGNIVDTDPPAGKKLDEGATLSYTVSIGKTEIPLPADLLGKAEAEVRARLQEAEFKVGESRTEVDEKTPKGAVIKLLDDAGQVLAGEAEKQSLVTMVVSNGPEQRTVPPALEGQKQDVVAKALTQLRLVPNVVAEFSDTVAKDSVISIAPPAGTKVDADTPIAVTVSKGPAPRVVPNVVGKSHADARAELLRLGFTIKGTTGDSTGRLVLTTDPPAGETHPFGTAIQIIMRSS